MSPPPKPIPPILYIWSVILFMAVGLHGGLSRDPILSFVDIVCLVLTPAAAFLEAKDDPNRRRYFFFGCICGAFFSLHYLIGFQDKIHSNTSDATLYVNFAFGVLLTPATAIACRLAATLRNVKRPPKDPTPYCKTCRYNLTGNVSGICPECGTPIEHADVDPISIRDRLPPPPA